jgi:hypothetical protein
MPAAQRLELERVLAPALLQCAHRVAGVLVFARLHRLLLLGHIEEIVRRGRMRGFIPWLITQRPAVVHKDVLSQADIPIAMKLTVIEDRDGIGGWIEGPADRQDRAAKPSRYASSSGVGDFGELGRFERRNAGVDLAALYPVLWTSLHVRFRSSGCAGMPTGGHMVSRRRAAVPRGVAMPGAHHARLSAFPRTTQSGRSVSLSSSISNSTSSSSNSNGAPSCRPASSTAAKKSQINYIIRAKLRSLQTGPCQTHGDGPEAVADLDRGRQF